MNFFTEPLQYAFMQQALWVALCVGVCCALLSCLIVLKGWALMGDGIGHGILPGVVLASFFSLPLWLGAFIAGLFCALGSAYIHERTPLRADTVLGIVFAGLFALGILLFLELENGNHLTHILFGNLLGVQEMVRKQVLYIAIPVSFFIILNRRDLMLFIFDEAQARMVGLPVRALYIILLTLLALTVVVAISAVGVVMVAALLITPGISAQLVVKRFDMMLIVAVLLTSLACVLGVFFSFYWDASTAAIIVLFQALGFLLMLLLRFILQIIVVTF